MYTYHVMGFLAFPRSSKNVKGFVPVLFFHLQVATAAHVPVLAPNHCCCRRWASACPWGRLGDN